LKIAGAAVVAAAFLTTPVAAANIPAGQKLAQVWCAGCHVVDAGENKTGNDAVPSFLSIARRPSTSESSLAVFLSTSHGRMPDYSLSRREIRDVSAYILSLPR
jgi:cytochrome c